VEFAPLGTCLGDLFAAEFRRGPAGGVAFKAHPISGERGGRFMHDHIARLHDKAAMSVPLSRPLFKNSLVSASGPVSGRLDDTPFDGPRELAAGHHEFTQTDPSDGPLVLVWAQAIERGLLAVHADQERRHDRAGLIRPSPRRGDRRTTRNLSSFSSTLLCASM
jgi:hypothetical protein